MVTLREGDTAPAFTGKDQDGKERSLAEFSGQKLLLYFFGEAGSPTCTIESCNLRDNYTALRDKGFVVVGVSPDKQEAQRKFKSRFDLPFTLIADTDNKISLAYGVWDMKKLFGREYMGILRTSFVIDEKGIIQHIFHKPKNKAHAQEILAAIK